MKIVSTRLLAVAVIAMALSPLGTRQASAAFIGVQFGTPPPPPPVYVERPWVRPYRGAIWIQPHYELYGHRWVWVRGYYSYPPRRGGYWIPSRYRHGYYYPGHWGY